MRGGSFRVSSLEEEEGTKRGDLQYLGPRAKEGGERKKWEGGRHGLFLFLSS